MVVVEINAKVEKSKKKTVESKSSSIVENSFNNTFELCDNSQDGFNLGQI